MNRPSKYFGVFPCLAAVAIVICISLCGCKSGTSQPAKTSGGSTSQPGGSGPGASGQARSPKELALGDFLKTMKIEGKPVLIEFGTVGCELSGKGLDDMIALQNSNAAAGLALVRVEGNSDAVTVRSYFDGKAPPFGVFPDGESKLAKALGATAIPTFVLADKFGHIRYTGKYPGEELVAWGLALAAETSDPGSQAPLFGVRQVDVAKALAATLPGLDGEPKALKSYMAEGGMVLLFVDTTCPFSAVALKDMPAVAKTLAGRKINALVVNNDDAREKVADFYSKNDPGAPIVYDTSDATRHQWNVQSVPIAVYIDPSGKIAYQGEAVWANLGAAVEKALHLEAGGIKFTPAGTGFG